jgi:predicted outer membrane repeat protein
MRIPNRDHQVAGSIFLEHTARQPDQEKFSMNPTSFRPSPRGRATAALLIMFTVALVLLAPAARPASAGIIPATIVVTKTTIENTDGDGCSLYEALQATFNGATYHQCTAGPDMNIIVFGGAAAGGTITFPAKPNDIELPMINKNVSIVGPITIDGNGAHTDQHIFRIAPNGTLNLTAMVLQNAHTSGGGGAILDNNHGTLNIAGVSFNNNVAEGDGGAINSNGTVRILTSNFVGNRAQGVANGDISSATGYGGAIYMDGSDGLTLAASNFSGNLANKGGGALHFSADQADISDVFFTGNIVNGTGSDAKAPKGGGAISNDTDATLSVVRTVFGGNLTPTSSGGALYNNINATAVISQTSFTGNIAASPGNSTSGGAIYNAGGNLTLLQDTFLNNAVILGDGGAIANDRHGSTLIANSSFIANAAAAGNGGAINNTNTQPGGPTTSLIAKNVTFSSNAALNSNGHGGTIFNAQGHAVSIGNSIVDAGVGDNCTGTITSLGHNLENTNTCGFNQAGDLTNVNPKLDSPAFNGGPIATLLTQKLLAGSPALDSADPAMCAAAPVNTIDQSGDPRPKGAACDIGSFENEPFVAGYGSTPVQPGPLAFGATMSGTPIDITFSIFETGNTTLHVSNPQFSGANAGEFAVKAVSPFPLDILDGGAAATITLTCTPAGVGSRSATLTLATNDPAHAQVAYNLSCDGTAVPQPSFASTPAAPGPIDFGDVTLNTGVNAPLTLKNVGDAALAISSAQFGGANPADFAAVTAFPINIAAGGAAVLAQVQCKPTNIGIRTATLTLATNDPAKPTVAYNLACQGEPVPPPILGVPGESLGNPLGAGNNGVYGIATSPDGKNVYATDNGDDLLMVFSRDTTTGNITFVENKINGSGVADLDGPYLVTVSADGQNVYVASRISSAILSFKRASDGTLTFLKSVKSGDPYGFCLPVCQTLQGLDGAYSIALSPDGQYGYISSITDNTITVLARNSTTGALELQPLLGPVQTYTSANVTQAYGIALSQDGANLYSTGYTSDNLEVLKRDPSNGRLTFVERHTNGQLGVDGLNGVFRVTVSPDGAFIYTASYDDSAVTIFKRDQSTGKLTYITKVKDGVGGVDGLGNASSVTVSPDGKRLFATGYAGDAVTVFDRDAAIGLLTQKQVIKRDTISGLPALDGARDTAFSPDGQTLYATGYLDNQVVALHMANPIPALTSLSPASAAAGSVGFKLTVNGASFVPGAVISIGPNAHATTFVNNTQLTTLIAASEITSVGQLDLTVANPTPGGGTSNAVKFTITAPNENPVPSIDTLGPASAAAGSVAFTLTINGSGFIASSAVQWNGANRPTSFVSSTKLTAQISVADIAQPGQAGVVVANPGPGGGASNAATFDIAAPGQHPTPSITGISPSQIMTDAASATDITLVIAGENFIGDSQAQWNGSNRPTSYLSATQLKVIVTAADLVAGGQGSITVSNPGPGGSESNTATFTIFTIRSRVYVALVVR